jgi:2-polyprenyl-6-methoxyphenol hydroxylase-like FAD-dependent oxidoreductase
MHFHLDPEGVILVASRPGRRMRIAIYFKRGGRGDLLRRPDPALHEYVVGRVPPLASARLGREHAHVYPLMRQLADRFAAPGAALVGDAAHTTHPTGATGMNLAIGGAARLADLVAPLLAGGPATAGRLRALDEALAAYEAERRPAAALAIEHNHRQSLRIWPAPSEIDPWAYARAANPASGWGAGGAGWGQDPAALGAVAPTAGGEPTGR